MKFFEKDGRVFMEVEPSPYLFKSHMVTDVLKSGRKFVIDMNSGILTIHTPERKKNKKKEEKKPVDHTLKEDLNTIFFKVDVWPYPPNFNPFIRLPGNSHEALGILESLMIDPVTRVGRLVCRATEEVLPINGTFMPLDVISYFAKYGKEEWR